MSDPTLDQVTDAVLTQFDAVLSRRGLTRRSRLRIAHEAYAWYVGGPDEPSVAVDITTYPFFIFVQICRPGLAEKPVEDKDERGRVVKLHLEDATKRLGVNITGRLKTAGSRGELTSYLTLATARSRLLDDVWPDILKGLPRLFPAN